MTREMLRRILIALSAALILLIAWQTSLYISHRGKIGVKIVVIPKDSSLSVDGTIKKAGRIYLTPGVHHLTASKTDFDSDTKAIDTAYINKGDTIYMLPAANSPAARAYLSEHPDIQRQREAAGGAESERIRSILAKEYPILSKLPQENLHYKIDYSVDSNQKLSLVVTTYGIINGPADYPQYVAETKAYKQEALDFLKHNGLNPNSVNITYTPNL